VAIETLDRCDTGADAPAHAHAGAVPFVAAAYVLSRLCVLAGFAVAAAFQAGMSLARIPRLWDGRWYLRLVASGYPHGVPEVAGKAAPSTLAFFPLFPLAVRLVSAVPGVSDAAAALVVSLASGALAAFLVHLLADRLAGPAVARRATLLFCFFPGSIVFSLVYSEGLMIALAAGCFLALGRRRWVLAGILAGLATACRPNAVVLVGACAWAAVAAIRRQEAARGALAAPALAVTGLAGFLAFLWLRTGEAGAWLRVQQDGWNQRVDFGRVLLNEVVWLLKSPFGDVERIIVVVDLAVAVAGLVFLVQLVRRRALPPALVVYAAGVVALASVYRVDVLRPRAVLAAFPLFIALGERVSRRTLMVLVALGAVGLVVLPWYYSLPFASSSSP